MSADELRPYRVDWGGDVYTRLREARGFAYDDALREAGDRGARDGAQDKKQQDKKGTVPMLSLLSSRDSVLSRSDQPLRLFMPGCALAAYSRELTLAVYDYLCDAGEVDGLSVVCCGRILDFAAPPRECATYAASVAALLAAYKVTRIVTACPNCYQTYTALAADICEKQDKKVNVPFLSSDTALAADPAPYRVEVLAVSEVLARRGVRFDPSDTAPFASVCVHDSCPSRADGVFAHSVRNLFKGVELREMAHSQARARCCGQGKLLPLKHPEQSRRCTSERLAEFDATGADCLVTYCANCAQALRGTSQPAYHYLELLFGIPIDWDDVASSWQEAQQ